MIDFYTASTPNGYKVAIALEELGLPYQTHVVDLAAGEQREPWFLELNPNGRIPAIVDHEADEDGAQAMFESGAILLHLAEKTGRLLSKVRRERGDQVQWLMFQMANVGPMQGQLVAFRRYASEVVPYALNRYEKETTRIYQVLDRRLADREYLAGDYSVADIATFPWVHFAWWTDFPIEPFPNVARWADTILARPAVRAGLQVPPMADKSRLLAAGTAMVRTAEQSASAAQE